MSRPVQPSSRGRTTIASEPSGAKIVTVCGAIVSKRYYETFRLNGYVALSGQAEKRAALYAAILQTAYVQQELLGSDKWTPKIIADRLHNALKARNKARAAAEGAEADAAAEAAAE